MNILVTGAGGQLATEIKEEVGIWKYSQNHYFFTTHKELAIADETAVNDYITKNNINVIVNCAAYTAVDKAGNPEELVNVMNTNAVGPKVLAAAAKKNDATLIHISTDYVFDGDANVPYAPNKSTFPKNIYGQSKLDGEIFIQDSGCKYIILRTSWLYSPYGKNFVKNMYNLMKKKDSIKVVMDQVGSPTYAADLAAFIVEIIETNKLSNVGTYHFANLGVASWYDLTMAIRDYACDFCLEAWKRCEGEKYVGINCNVEPCTSDEFPTPVKRPNFSVLNTQSLRDTFGYQIPYWRHSLQTCVGEIIISERNSVEKE